MHLRFLIPSALSLLWTITACGADPHGQTSWEHAPSAYKPPADLVKRGAFIDRILPMPVGPGDLTSDCWGGDNVKPASLHHDDRGTPPGEMTDHKFVPCEDGSDIVIPLDGSAAAGGEGIRLDLEVRGGGRPLVRRDLRPAASPAKPETGMPAFLKKHGDLYQESPRKAALAWYEDARLGMFIHWGVWGKHHAAWAMYQKRIPLGEYQSMARQVDASGFNAKEIVRLAEDTGMRYITFVAKHHDGFCLWDSKVSTWDSMDYPMHRDFVKELATACHARNMPLFIYYSIGIDWTHPHFIPRDLYPMARPDYPQAPDHFAYREPADFETYRTFCKAQLTELCTQYGPVAGFWFDTLGGVLANSDLFRMQEFYDLIHQHQPHALILFKTGATGSEDILVGERKLESIAMHYSGQSPQVRRIRELAEAAWKANFRKKAEIAVTSQGNWEWGPQQRCQNVDGLWNMLVSAADNNANLLLNFGPRPDGSIPDDVATHFRQLGERIRTRGYPPLNRTTYLEKRGRGGSVDDTENEKTAR